MSVIRNASATYPVHKKTLTTDENLAQGRRVFPALLDFKLHLRQFHKLRWAIEFALDTTEPLGSEKFSLCVSAPLRDMILTYNR